MIKSFLFFVACLVLAAYFVAKAITENEECQQAGGVYARPFLSFSYVCIK